MVSRDQSGLELACGYAGASCRGDQCVTVSQRISIVLGSGGCRGSPATGF